MSSRRFLDHPAASDWLRTTGEFVIRDHGPGRVWVVVGLLTTVVVLVAVADVAVGEVVLDTRLRVIVALLLAAFVLRTLFVVSSRLRLLELRVLLLSSSLRVGSRCFAIVRSSGAVVDRDQGFVDLFGIGDSIDALLDHPGLEAGGRDRIWSSLGGRHALTFELDLGDPQEGPLVMQLRPLARPCGYFLLRGEETADGSGATAEPRA